VQDSIVNKFSTDRIVVFGLTPNEDPYHKLKEYVADKKITFDMLYNADEVFDAYGVNEEPTHVLIDKEGQIRFRADNTFYFFRISILIAEIQKII